MIRVKVCGITTLADARAALDAGADAIGLVFHPGSSRRVTVGQAREISDFVGARAARVGVVVDATAAELELLVGACHLTAVQANLRSCPRELVAEVSVPVLPYLGSGPSALVRASAWWPRLPVLLDAVDASGGGGTGRASDLGAAAALARHRPVWLAGGLAPENVAAAVRAVRPVGVDASSSLEASPGRKDPAKVLSFVTEARRAAELS